MQKVIEDHGREEISGVDLYIMKFNDGKQEKLQIVRSAIKEKHPGASERIYYGIPTVEEEGKIILQYAAYKKHISLIVGNILPAILKEKYPQYDYTEYTVVFPDNKPFPEDFIKEICGIGRLDGRTI